MLTPDMLDRITGHTRRRARKAALCRMINDVSPEIHDLRPPHVLAQFLAQVLHESAGLRYVKELWGPTAAQRRYEGRRDLGNTQRGDGKRFMGRDLIQVTGRYNYRSLTAWLRKFLPGAPDFEADPAALERPEYLGWGALWYWATRVPARYVKAGNIEMVTRRVNGGLNGYADRLKYYDRAALVLLGYAPDDVRGFQIDQRITVDGISGPETRGAMHAALSAKAMAVVVDKSAPPPAPTPAPRTGAWAGVLRFILDLFKGKSA